jgi:hypothetical protein
VVAKKDAGPGRLSKEAESIDFWTEMATMTMGVHILLSLPNGTVATAEMDQLYSKFKPRCSESTIRVGEVKMAKRAAARKKREAAKRRKEDSGVADDVDDEDNEDDDDDDNDDEGGGRGKKKHSRSACNVSLGNRDLSNIVNGFPGDDVSKRPFDYTFTKANIINSWIAVGFLPMTANAVNDPKVRYELGEGGAPEAEQKRITDLVEDYQQSRSELAELGFNADILDLQPKVAVNQSIPADEEAAIEALMKKGGANKAGSLFRVGISVANCRVVLETLRRTKEQAEKVKEQKEKSRQVAEDGKVKAALEAFGKWCGNGMKLDGESHPVMTRTCAVAIVKVLMPAVAPTLKVSDFTTLKSCTKWLGELGGGTTWVDEMTAIRDRNELEEIQPTELFGA